MEAHAQGPSLAARRKARSAQPPAAANPVAHRENFRHLETQLSFSLYAMDRACQSQTPSSSRGDCLQRQTLLASAKGVSDGTGLAGGVAKPLLCKARDRGAIAPRGAILHQKPRKLPTFARRFKPPRSASTLPRAPVSFHVKHFATIAPIIYSPVCSCEARAKTLDFGAGVFERSSRRRIGNPK